MYSPILATLGFVLSPDGKKTLLVLRNKCKDDHHYGKFNGLGGKVKASENIIDCIEREIYEEAKIVCKRTELRGTISWPGFGKKGESWFGFIFVVRDFEGIPLKSNEEGDLSWKKIDDLPIDRMWEGDRFFLSMVFDADPRLFHGVMPYENGEPIKWNFTRG